MLLQLPKLLSIGVLYCLFGCDFVLLVVKTILRRSSYLVIQGLGVSYWSGQGNGAPAVWVDHKREDKEMQSWRRSLLDETATSRRQTEVHNHG
jgi:hypothetical protein